MTAEDLLAKLEKGELVSPEVIASLRRQIAAAPEPIPAAAVAKLLVDKKHLTAGQAQRLLEQTAPSQIAKQPSAATPAAAAAISKVAAKATPAPAKPAAPATHNSSVHDDLGLAPLDDLDALSSPPSSIAKTPAAKSTVQKAPQPQPAVPKPAAPAAHNSSVLDDLGLAPLDDLDALSPAPSAVAKTPVAPAAKSTIKPAAAPAAPAAKLDDLGLAPLDDLSPVNSPPATPAAKSTIQKAAPPAAPQKSAIQKQTAKPAAPTPAAKGLADLPPLDDLGGLTALDELPSLDGLDPLGSDPLGDPLSGGGLADLSSPLGATADLGGLATQTAAPARAQITPATVAAVQAAQESRTTLFVGIAIGAVALLVVVIGLAVFLWPRGDGMKEFQAAEQAYQEKQYAAAIEKYDELLRSHPRHEQASLIRAHRGMSTIHAASGSPTNWARLLPVMHDTAVPLAAEPAITQIHPELAPLLIQMTEALADAATDQKLDEQSANRLQQARAALALCNDSRLLPSTLRPWQQLASVEERLQLLARAVQQTAAREEAKVSLTQALSAGNIAAAWQARTKALSAYPELANDELWAELAPQFTAAAVKSVKTIADKRAAEQDAAKSPLLVALPWQLLNARLQASAAPASERVVLVNAAGAIHALDAGNGQVQWSRYLACSPTDRPLISADSRFAWLVDRQQHELVSVNALTGNLLWRQPLGDAPVGSPLLIDSRIYLTLAKGKLQSFEASSGELQATAELPQPAACGAIAMDDGQQLLQLADEGLLYVLNAADLKCTAAHYLGHARGTALFPPVVFQRQIVVAAQRGEQTELFLVPPDGGSSSIKRQRLEAAIGAPLVIANQRLLVSTTHGKLHALELGDGNEPLKLVHTLPAAGPPLLRYLQTSPDGIIAADRGLTQLKFDTAGKLQAGWTAFPLDVSEGSGHVHDQVCFTARYVADQDAHIAAAVNTTDGLAIWQTPLQTPVTLLAGEEGSRPVAVSASAIAKLLTHDSTVIDLTAEFKKNLSQPNNVNLKAPPLGAFITVGDEQLLTPPRGSRELLFVKPLDFAVRKLKLPGALAGQPAVCGQNLLVPLSDGAIHSLNSTSGTATAAPFLLPTVTSSTSLTVTALDEAGKEALVSNGSTLLKISLIVEPQPHWVEQAAVRPLEPLVAPPIALAEVVFAADRRGQLQMFSLPDLRAGQPLDFKGGQVTWGPHRAGDCVLLATDRDELWCCDSARQPRWQQPLAAGQPIGLPQVSDNKLIIASASGAVEVRAAGSGDVASSVQLQQPLAGSVLISGNTLWLSTSFGQVLQVAIPTESPQP
jgi:outer membrane protein assembly factor BamB